MYSNILTFSTFIYINSIKTCTKRILIFRRFRHVLSTLQSSLVIQIGKVMGHLFTGGQRDMALSTRQSVVAKSRQLQMMNWKHGKKLSFSLHLQATHHKISTMVMKQLYSTNLSPTELTALIVISLLDLQNIKTD